MGKKASSQAMRCIALASVWFGNHVGGGFAMGRQSVNFYVRYGWTAILFPTVAMILVGMSFYYAWNFARLTQTFDYRGYVNKFYSPFEKSFATLVDIFFLITVCLPIGSSIAGGGELIKTIFGAPYLVGVIFTALVFLFFSIFGANLVRRMSVFLTAIIVVTLGAIAIMGIVHRSGEIGAVLSNRTMAPGQTMGTALWGAILYASFQSNNAPHIAAADQMQSKKDVIYTTAIGIFLNALLLTLMCVAEIGWYPEIIQVPIANLAIVSDLGSSVLYAFYCIALYAAYITTAVTFLFAVGKRFDNSFIFSRLKEDSLFKRKPERRSQIVIVIAIIYSFLASLLGLVVLINKGYTYLGYIYIPLVLLPQLIIGPIKCRKLEKELQQREAAGSAE